MLRASGKVTVDCLAGRRADTAVATLALGVGADDSSFWRLSGGDALGARVDVTDKPADAGRRAGGGVIDHDQHERGGLGRHVAPFKRRCRCSSRRRCTAWGAPRRRSNAELVIAIARRPGRMGARRRSSRRRTWESRRSWRWGTRRSARRLSERTSMCRKRQRKRKSSKRSSWRRGLPAGLCTPSNLPSRSRPYRSYSVSSALGRPSESWRARLWPARHSYL